MYTRSYNDERSEIVIPESYGGTSLFDAKISDDSQKTQNIQAAEPEKNPWEKSEDVHTSATPKEHSYDKDESFLSKLPFSDFLSNIFKKDKFSLQNIGKEEILIIATAAFLFFSKDGDRECAIMLLLLLFL